MYNRTKKERVDRAEIEKIAAKKGPGQSFWLGAMSENLHD